MEQTEKYERIRDAIARMVYWGNLSGAKSGTLTRYNELVRLYDTACAKKQEGCLFAVYGSPKMGKSTLFNSVMGESVLPCHPIPTTGSIIDLKKDANKKFYEVDCKLNGVSNRNRFETPSDVCEFLDLHATQNSRFDSVSVCGPFPHAMPFMSHNCTLRDTPGAEAMLGETDREIDELLEKDSKRAIKSLDDTCVPLFCVSAKTVGAVQDYEFYNRFFRDRCCLHVLTHIDAISRDVESNDTQAVVDNFMRVFGILPSMDDPRPIVCTGIKNVPEGDTMVNIGLKGLVHEMENFISQEELGKRLHNVALYILQNDIDWDVGAEKGILFATLESLTND